MNETDENRGSTNFIRGIIDRHNQEGRFDGRVHTRFPPEPNGYLHIGHTRSIWLNMSIAKAYGGKFNLRFDDTNPTKEETEFVDGIIEDVKWLGGEWEDRLLYASDYFDQLYEWALQLIAAGKAYVDDLSQQEIREYRGTLTEPGRNSPYRNRTVQENYDLFQRMREGEFAEGEKSLRAKIDMASPIINLRDPVMYRILHHPHHRTGDKWHIYPMYDWAHGQSDSIEGITHSLCTLEYENHRPLYDWYIEQLGIYAPQQIEFAPLQLTYTMTSKRRLRRLVNEGHVDGWDDPRMPTVAALRRRGVTPEAIWAFNESLGVGKALTHIDYGLFENAIRNDLNIRAARVMGVLNPLKVIITNYPEGKTEQFPLKNFPQNRESQETREVPFTREIYIEQGDFMEEPHGKYFRLAPGREVRLLGAYFVTYEDVVKDEEGNIVELHVRYDPETRGGSAPDGRKVKGTIHWVSADWGLPATVRLYDRLFNVENPKEAPDGGDFIDNLNPDSLTILEDAIVEPRLATAQIGDCFQFMRQGYFAVDSDSTAERLLFNRTVSLRDVWQR